jgi:hypothetical protein
VDDGVGGGMSFDGLENTNSANIVSSGNHDSGSILELNDSADLFGLEIELKE